MAWLSSGIAETVTNDLRATSPLRIIDRVRVVEAVQRAGADLSALRAELHLDLAVVGSFQRAGDRLRITARVVDAARGEALADAKADGPLEQVFDLQDRIVAQFAETLGNGDRTTSRGRIGETSSLEAYRAFTEGRVRLESLDASLVPAAIADFERAIGARPALRSGARRPRQRPLLAVRNVARAQSAGRGAAGAGDRSRAARHRSRARSRPKRMRRSRSCW